MMILAPGDQAFLERASSVIYDRSNEERPEERFSCCVPVPQEFHALKVPYIHLQCTVYNVQRTAPAKGCHLVYYPGGTRVLEAAVRPHVPGGRARLPLPGQGSPWPLQGVRNNPLKPIEN